MVKITSTMLLAAVLAVIGLFYVAAPHTLHISSGFGLGWDHTAHMVLGFVLFVLAGIAYSISGKTKPARRK